MTTTRIVGLGSMGAGMACNLLQGGFALAVDDLDADRVAALVTAGAVESDADIIDDDLCAFLRGQLRNCGTDAAACAGDNDDFAFHHFGFCHDVL